MPSSLDGQSIRLEGESLHITFASISSLYSQSSAEIIFKCLLNAYPQAFTSPSTLTRGDAGNQPSMSLDASPALSLDISASFELHRMLGNGEVIGRLEMSWHELLDHGEEPFELSFPSVCGDHPSLTLQATVLHHCDDADGASFDSIVEYEIARDTDAGHARFAKYVSSKSVSDLNNTVEHFQLVLSQCPLGHDDHAGALTNLAWARLKGYIEGDFQDIDSIISLFREALALRPQGHPDHTISLYHLTEALTWRYMKEPTTVYIRESTQLYCKLLSLCPEGTYLHSIAAGANGVDYVIDECNKLPTDGSDEDIHLRRIVLEFCPLGHQHRPGALNNLSTTLRSRFKQCGSVDDLDECIKFCREAISLCSEGHSERDKYLNHLAASLRSRFSHQGRSHDLDEAIFLYEEALCMCPVGHEGHHVRLSTLGGALRARFTERKDVDDINRAISLRREALTLSPPGHPHHDETLNNLAVALKNRYDKFNVSEDLNEAIDLQRESIRLMRLDNPERHRHLCNLSWLFDDHVMTRSSIISRREAATAFRGAQSLPVDAASCAIRRDNLRQAVELAEQGRGQQWSLASRLRTPLEDLESTSPELACKLSELSKSLSDVQGSATLTDRVAADVAATQYRRLTERWGAAVAEIRNLKDLQAAACQGPVIILIASQYSCSAIVVPTSGEPHHIPFPSVTLTDLKDLKDRFARAIRNASTMGPKQPRNDLIVLLRAVWDEIMLPVVNVLQQDLKLKSHSRIWLCPTAAFTSRQMMKKRVAPSFVTIGQGQPGAGKGKALLAVDSELELPHELEALQQNTWVHLACHGKQDPTQPYDSHFVMRDEPLTLLDIMEKDIPHAEFAFLSACHTAVGDEKIPDEVIHLAAGLQFSGFKSVVGTLWEVNDAVAKHVVEAFYENMFEDLEVGGVMDCTKAAWALNRATHAVKTTVPLEQRMVFIHIGILQVVSIVGFASSCA
ncbi:CHAT domain-containing protein [Suillus placidus]|uniref:CHAT domain-containing protein n=1 Tax=Suillus placidus TaxID=48579 RepID=A0A9P7D6A9_9AGAM|nr:CHAT domain-containing protein [Suillus placidus]